MWHKNLIPWHAIILWLTLKKLLKTRDKLLRIGVILDAMCVLCHSMESMRHSMFSLTSVLFCKLPPKNLKLLVWPVDINLPEFWACSISMDYCLLKQRSLFNPVIWAAHPNFYFEDGVYYWSKFSSDAASDKLSRFRQSIFCLKKSPDSLPPSRIVYRWYPEVGT